MSAAIRLLVVYAPSQATRTTQTPRQRQHQTSRSALRSLFAILDQPAPNISNLNFPHRWLSLSHTERGSAALAALGPLPHPLAGVGIDLEADQRVDHRASRFFLSESERDWLATVPEPQRHGEHVRLWTVKEALFKSDPANENATLRGFTVLDPSAHSGHAVRITAQSALRFRYVTGRLHPGLQLTVAVSSLTPARERGLTPMPTTTNITFEAVAERISRLLSVPTGQITPETTLRELTADSFRLVETVVDLQEEFDSVFTQAELRQVCTIGELVELLRSQH